MNAPDFVSVKSLWLGSCRGFAFNDDNAIVGFRYCRDTTSPVLISKSVSISVVVDLRVPDDRSFVSLLWGKIAATMSLRSGIVSG